VVAQFGLRALASAQCFTAAFALLTCIVLQSKLANVDWLEITKGAALLIVPSSLIMVVAVFLVRESFSEALSWHEIFVLQIVTGVLIYACVLAMLVALSRRLRWLASLGA